MKEEIEEIIHSCSDSEVRLILIDLNKRNEFESFSKTEHLLTPLVTDEKNVYNALRWSYYEIERREKMIEENALDFLPVIRIYINGEIPNFEPMLDQVLEKIRNRGETVKVKLIES
jgi:S-DNA-T family DNA segregation ATPase FtsK/SpoIIIE